MPAQTDPSAAPAPATPAASRTAGRSSARPAMGLGRAGAERPVHAHGRATAADEVLPPARESGRGRPSTAIAYAEGKSLALKGLTKATFDGGAYDPPEVEVTPAKGCTCKTSPCIHATGTLRARYSVATTVTLPSADDFPHLTDCQRARVQQAIDTVLAPHEQEHVEAFNRYNGSTSQTFDLTVCRGKFNGAIHKLFLDEERARRAAAQAASDALDPFVFEVSLDCSDSDVVKPPPQAHVHAPADPEAEDPAP